MRALLNDDIGFSAFRIAVLKAEKSFFFENPHCRQMGVIAEILMDTMPVEPFEGLEENIEATIHILQRIVKDAYSQYKAEIKEVQAAGGQFSLLKVDNATASPKRAKKEGAVKKPITGFKKKPQIQEIIEFDGEVLGQKSANPALLTNIFN